jgi:hypothetical protein
MIGSWSCFTRYRAHKNPVFNGGLSLANPVVGLDRDPTKHIHHRLAMPNKKTYHQPRGSKPQAGFATKTCKSRRRNHRLYAE